MADRDTIAILAGELASAFQPLAAAVGADGAFLDLLAELGWTFTAVPPELEALKGPVGTVANLVAAGTVGTGQIPALLEAVKEAFGAISDLRAPSSLSDEFRSTFPRQLVDYLVVRYLLTAQPRWGYFLMALGIVTVENVDAQGDRPAYVLYTFAVEDIGDFLSQPLDFLKNSYSWGNPDFDGERLAVSVTGMLRAWNLTVNEERVDTASQNALQAGALDPDNALDLCPQLVLVENSLDDDVLSAGVGLYLLPETSSDRPGFALLPFVTADFGDTVAVTSNLTISFQAEVDLTTDVGLFVRPNRDVQFLGALDSGAPAPVSGELKVVMSLGQPSDPILIVGAPGASRFEFGGISTTAGLRLGGTPDVFTEFALQRGRIVIAPGAGEGDSFLSSILPSNLEVDFDLVVGFSTAKGIYFGGSGKLEVALPLQVKVGSVQITSASCAVGPQAGAIVANVTATVSADLSVLRVSIQDVGVGATVTFPDDRKGNLGPAQMGGQFRPPAGVGIAVDAGSVHGGGFIAFDPTNSRYAGALQLSIYDIAVNAFGLIETPSSGYSFVIVISAQFTPIQLGFGFTLNGVGGMVGINRAIDTAALANLVRAGQSEELLFPKNVVADAPTIVRDLTSVFPATQGHYVFGPLGKLGWGTPTLITGEIGIILEIPGPVVVILGEVKCLLPKPDAALVKLNLSVDGELDFPNKLFAMDAALHDSVINGFPVSGQMAMRVGWGTQPNFVFSIGGFHPAYTPPPNFPKLQPMTLDLGSHGPAKLSVSGFFAVTSNTVQVGGSASLHASGSGISLDASVSVKALFVFQPFSFEADIDASVKISFHGYGPSVHLSGVLDGPSPWHIKGEVCVSIIWWDACLGFDVTFGGATQVTQPSLDPWQDDTAAPGVRPAILRLKDAFSDPGNWSGAQIPGTVSSVTRAQGTDTLVDPAGGLTVRQKVAPVETANPLTKFGVAKTPAPIKFSGVQATLGTNQQTVSLTAVAPVNEPFAPAQFFDMDDGKKLSSAGFEQYQAGYLFTTAGGKNAQGGSAVTFTPVLQTFVINSDGSDTPITGTLYKPSDTKVTAFNKRSAVAKGGLTQAGTRRFVNRAFTPSFTERLPTFVIGDRTTLAVPTAVAPPPAAVRSATLIALDVYRAQNVELARTVQVTALYDMPNPPMP